MSVDWRKMPSLSALRAFEAVAGAGDFAGAARALNVTHAAISQQIRGLERELGVALAQRSGRSVVLTFAGERLAQGLTEGFGTISQRLESIKAHEMRRAIRVTTTPFIVDTLIMPHLSDFWAKHPGVEISLQPQAAFLDLAKDGFDLGVRAAGVGSSWSGVETQFLCESPWLVVGVPEFGREPAADPLELPWVWSDRMHDVSDALHQAGVDPGALRKVDVGSHVLQWQAAQRGLGLTLASWHVAREGLTSGRLVSFPLPGLPSSAYYVVTPTGPKRAIVAEFINWLAAVFQGALEGAPQLG